MLAHQLLNVLGFVGITVAGTLLTLWPTLLRTKIDPAAMKRSAAGLLGMGVGVVGAAAGADRKSTRLNSSHVAISYAVFCLKKKKKNSYGSCGAWCEMLCGSGTYMT